MCIMVERGLKEPSRKRLVTLACAGLVLLAWEKTHLQHILSAVATKMLRFVQWRMGAPWAKTRTSRFAALAA